ncbi:hypothetical protein PAXINDRAFT_133680 [Paxillus involutus ATCC 200175]|uniref:Uncharacterized protein n=1 Tax=Paxillus involutus ATCC 200175 TaxID=664439 RepID=A0A0C9TIU0_PAXIN|nr:hypothetical protein PAXINDRAFT_133680 [Paxillus involutus ATCC 200175]
MSPALTTLTLGQSLCRRALLQKLVFGTANGQSRHFCGWVTSLGLSSGHRILSTKAALPSVPSPSRWISQSSRASQSAASQASSTAAQQDNEPASYQGPLTQTFRRLKIFSLASLGLTFTMAPFIFIVESSLPMSARIFLAATAISTSGISTALVSWCGAPYVSHLRRLIPAENGGIEGIEMTTLTLTLKKQITRVYDSDFLVETRRPFAKWELAQEIQLPPPSEDALTAAKSGAPGEEETVAETLNEKGEIIGRWIVKWGEAGAGTCQATGRVLRYFNVHEELL